MDQERGVWQTCIHEAAHGLMAHAHGWPVLSLQCSAARDGVCHFLAPFWPLEMPPRFRAAPLQTRKELTQIVSVSIAPSIVLAAEHSAGDRTDLSVWEHVWNKCRWGSYHGDPWDTIYGEAQDAVSTWLQRPGTAVCLEHAAAALARRRFLSAEDFKALVRQGQTQRPALPVASRSPVSPVASRPARRQAAANRPSGRLPLGFTREEWEKRRSKPMPIKDYAKVCGEYHLSSRGLVCLRAPGNPIASKS
jgi:hypothetical protein